MPADPPSLTVPQPLPLSPPPSLPLPKRILVTGGAGFIGSHLVKLLLDRGVEVRVIDLRPSDGLDGRADFYQGSVFDPVLLRAALEGVGWVFHLAANPNLWAADKESFLQANVETVRTVIDAAAAAGAGRIVHTSTESILVGRGHRQGTRVDETSAPPLEALFGPYCRSKLLGEQVALAAAARGLPVIVVNPTLPVGPGDHRLTPPTHMLMGFLNGDHPAYLDFRMNIVDVRDVAEGHVLAAGRGRVGERYILGGENLSMTRVLEILAAVTGLPMPTRRIPYALALAVGAVSEVIADRITRRPPEATLTGIRLAGAGLFIDSTKAAQELGYAPTPIRGALADAVAWLADAGHLRRRPARVVRGGAAEERLRRPDPTADGTADTAADTAH